MLFMDFQLNNRGSEGYAFEYKEDGQVLAELTWTQLGDIMVVDHTFVDPSLRGQGLAVKLLDRAAEYAREKDYKIEAVCSFVLKAFSSTDKYDDIKA